MSLPENELGQLPELCVNLCLPNGAEPQDL